MSAGKHSLKQEHRRRILQEARARGHGSSNLWYVYSVKLNRDLVLPSDSALIYWVVFLEIDLDVVEFSQSEGGDGFDFLVKKQSGSVSEVVFSDLEEPSGSEEGCTIRISRRQLLSKAPLAIKAMKAMAYAAAIRGSACTAASNAVRAIEVSLGAGDVQAVLRNAPLIAPPIICGVLVRHFIAGLIEIDLTKESSFGRYTQWKCRT